MNWQEGVAVAMVILGLAAGAFLVAQRPSFWIEFASSFGKALLPLAWRFATNRMLPEDALYPLSGGDGRARFVRNGISAILDISSGPSQQISVLLIDVLQGDRALSY